MTDPENPFKGAPIYIAKGHQRPIIIYLFSRVVVFCCCFVLIYLVCYLFIYLKDV